MITKAIKRASQFPEYPDVAWIRQVFERVQRIPGANKLFKRLASAPDKNQFSDYFTEVEYALVFAGLGFKVTIEPLGPKGPDFEVSRDGQYAMVEITRFRDISPGPPEFNIYDSILPDYGNPQRDTRKSFDKLLSKFNQVKDNNSIIALWNDDGDLEEVEVRMAVECLRRGKARQTLKVPEGLLFVIYASKWVRLGDHKQIYCFSLIDHVQTQYSMWQHELGNATVRDLMNRAMM